MLLVFENLTGIPTDCEDALNDVKAMVEGADIESAKELFLQIEEIN